MHCSEGSSSSAIVLRVLCLALRARGLLQLQYRSTHNFTELFDANCCMGSVSSLSVVTPNFSLA